MDTDENRTELIRRARAIVQRRHRERYGFDLVAEEWLEGMSDDQLRAIVEADDSPGFPGVVW